MDVFDYLKNEIHIKVGVSNIEGVGLIALKDIPKNTNISIEPPEEWANMKFKVKKDRLKKELHPNVFRVLCNWGGDGDIVRFDLWPCLKYHYYMYVNHSSDPNAAYNKYYNIVCIKDIKENEEITVKYSNCDWI